MNAKKEGRCDMFDQTNVGKERGMPIEDDDDDDGDFKIVASIYENFEKRTLIFLRLMQSHKNMPLCTGDNTPIVTFSINFRIKTKNM